MNSYEELEDELRKVLTPNSGRVYTHDKFTMNGMSKESGVDLTTFIVGALVLSRTTVVLCRNTDIRKVVFDTVRVAMRRFQMVTTRPYQISLGSNKVLFLADKHDSVDNFRGIFVDTLILM